MAKFPVDVAFCIVGNPDPEFFRILRDPMSWILEIKEAFVALKKTPGNIRVRFIHCLKALH